MAQAIARPTARPLILCADDYGMSAPVSEAIIALAQVGALSATSAMVLSPRWAADAQALKPLAKQLDVGLHLDWTSAFAQAAGHGQSLPVTMARAAAGAWRTEAVRTAIERQFDAFEAHWQAPPDHIDGHQHVHQMNGIRQVLLEVLARRYPHQQQHRPWVRLSQVPTALHTVKSAIVAAWGARALQRALAASHWPAAPWLAGMYDFAGTPERYAQLMHTWLQHSPAGTVIMCHPASSLDTGDAIGAARVREFAHLSSPDFLASLEQAHVRLVRGHTFFTHP
jgi:hypothetical protein